MSAVTHGEATVYPTSYQHAIGLWVCQAVGVAGVGEGWVMGYTTEGWQDAFCRKSKGFLEAKSLLGVTLCGRETSGSRSVQRR